MHRDLVHQGGEGGGPFPVHHFYKRFDMLMGGPPLLTRADVRVKGEEGGPFDTSNLL